MQNTTLGKLRVPVLNTGFHAMAQVVQLLGDMSVIEKSWSDEFGLVKEERDRLLQEANAQMIAKSIFEKVLLNKEVVMKAMRHSVGNV